MKNSGRCGQLHQHLSAESLWKDGADPEAGKRQGRLTFPNILEAVDSWMADSSCSSSRNPHDNFNKTIVFDIYFTSEEMEA